MTFLTQGGGRSSGRVPLHARVALLAGLALTGSQLAACGDGDADRAGGLLVFAAASLTDAFTELGETFEVTHQGATVTFLFDGSPSLRDQILAGAPADVIAPASATIMDTVVAEEGVLGEPVAFATNGMQIAVPPGNPAGVTGLADLGDPDRLIGLCDEAVPCGQLGRRVLAAAGVEPAPDTNEPDARTLLAKVESGELDAGLVYRSDILSAAGGVEGIPIPAEHDTRETYPVAVLARTGNQPLAETFVDLVLSDDGQDILERHGLGRP